MGATPENPPHEGCGGSFVPVYNGVDDLAGGDIQVMVCSECGKGRAPP